MRREGEGRRRERDINKRRKSNQIKTKAKTNNLLFPNKPDRMSRRVLVLPDSPRQLCNTSKDEQRSQQFDACQLIVFTSIKPRVHASSSKVIRM